MDGIVIVNESEKLKAATVEACGEEHKLSAVVYRFGRRRLCLYIFLFLYLFIYYANRTQSTENRK